MSALKLCKRSKGLDTGYKEQVLMHSQIKCSPCQCRSRVCSSSCLFMCKINIVQEKLEVVNLKVLIFEGNNCCQSITAMYLQPSILAISSRDTQEKFEAAMTN